MSISASVDTWPSPCVSVFAPRFPSPYKDTQVALVVKNSPANEGDVRDVGLIPGSGRSPREGNGSPLQYSCLENPMDRGAWWAIVHGVTKSWTQLKQLSHIRTPVVLM